MGIVRDLYYARKMSAGLKLPAPTVALLIKRLRLAAAMGGDVTKTVSGTMVHITDALAKAALSVLVSIEPIQDLHGYSNPWPGGGGINKADYPAIIAAGATEQSDGSLYVPSATAYNNLVIFQNDGTAGQFTITFKSKNPGTSRGVYPVVKYTDNTTQRMNVTGHTDYATVTLTTNSAKTVDNVIFYYGSNVAAWFYVQVESGATAHDWTPYANICPISGRTGLSVYVSPTQDVADATTYAVDWTSEAGTVYGGTLDVVTGVLTVDKVQKLISELSWSKYNVSQGTLFRAEVSGMKTAISNVKADIICSAYPVVSQVNRTENTLSANGTSVDIIDSDYADAASFVATMGSQMFVYELATPLTYQLTAQEVQMLLGENYVWSSSGDTVSVTYYAEGNANTLQSLNILLGGRYSNPKTADDVSDKEALEIILGGNK